MRSDLHVHQFARLFAGRRDAYGTEQGGCNRTPVSHLLIERHLDGTEPIGIYPVARVASTNQAVCRWGCIDLDIRTPTKPSGDYQSADDAHIAAINLQNTWAAFGVTAWIERTRSDGRHVWMFPERWMPIAIVRDAQQVVCQVAGASAREINPKQRDLPEGQLGNYVRLPYAGQQRPIIHSDGAPVPFNTFVERAWECRVAADLLTDLAGLWSEPEPAVPHLSVRVPAGGPGRVDPDIWFRMLPKARAVFAHGPADGDRSDGLAYLAHQCRASGLSAGETATVLAATSWNKFAGRSDEHRRIEQLVAAAWR